MTQTVASGKFVKVAIATESFLPRRSLEPLDWTESAVNLAVVGAAWVVADSLARPAEVASELRGNGGSEVRAS